MRPGASLLLPYVMKQFTVEPDLRSRGDILRLDVELKTVVRSVCERALTKLISL